MVDDNFDSITKDLLSLDCVKELENLVEWKSRLLSKIAGERYFERVRKHNNYLAHSIRVARLAYKWVPESSKRDCTRAAILHDIGKGLMGPPYLIGDGHSRIGAEFLRELGENETVVNAVRRHMFPMSYSMPRTRVDWTLWLADRYDTLKRNYYTFKCLFC